MDSNEPAWTTAEQTQGSKPTVAVVITTYNHAVFLADAIESCLAQTVAPDEIIVVDDGSTDDPAAVAAAYPQVAFIRQENQGVSAARNAGMEAASSERVIFLDADDRLCPNAVGAGHAAFAGAPDAGFVYGAWQWIDVDGRDIGSLNYTPIGPHPHLDFLRRNPVGMHAAVMYDRHRLQSCGGFDVTLRRSEDFDAFLRVTQRYPVASYGDKVAEYRRHGSNTSNNSVAQLAFLLKVLDRYGGPGVDSTPDVDEAWLTGRNYFRKYYVEELIRRRTGGLMTALAAALRISPNYTCRRLVYELALALRLVKPHPDRPIGRPALPKKA
jgi:glycosyltransferase involved in cell wall biosynthesis